jgi:ATP-dependent DNA helicase HFM1/MER3
VKEARFVMNTSHKQRLHQVANSLRDSKLRGAGVVMVMCACVHVLIHPELVLFGVGYHHAGLDTADRKAIELMFTTGDLPVLCKL